MSNEQGFSVVITMLVIVVGLVLVYTLYRNIPINNTNTANMTIDNMKKEVSGMHIPAKLLSTDCSRGDGVDSTPSCTFTYQSDNSTGIVSSVEAAGYKPLTNGSNGEIVLAKDRTSPHGINIFIHSTVELEIH